MKNHTKLMLTGLGMILLTSPLSANAITVNDANFAVTPQPVPIGIGLTLSAQTDPTDHKLDIARTTDAINGDFATLRRNVSTIPSKALRTADGNPGLNDAVTNDAKANTIRLVVKVDVPATANGYVTTAAKNTTPALLPGKETTCATANGCVATASKSTPPALLPKKVTDNATTGIDAGFEFISAAKNAPWLRELGNPDHPMTACKGMILREGEWISVSATNKPDKAIGAGLAA